MKQSLLIFILLVNLSSCAATSIEAQSKVLVKESDGFADVVDTIKAKTARYTNKQVLVVVDIDNTLLTSESDLGGDIWYQWQRGKLEVKPRAEQKVQCLFEDSINLLYELSPMKLTEQNLPVIIQHWQQQGITVFALTSRSPKSRAATERELSRAGIDFSQSALRKLNENTPVLREKNPREMSYMQGIMMTSGMNKGAMLRYMLNKTQRHFDAIVFVDDSQHNIDNLFNEFNNTNDIDMTLFHYTKVEDDRIKSLGAVLTQNQADKMATQWSELNQVLNSIYPSRQTEHCLSINE